MEYGYTPSTSNYAQYPIKVLEAFLHFTEGEDDSKLIPLYENKGNGDWGDEAPIEEDGTFYPMPGYTWLRWWSVPEQKCYEMSLMLHSDELENLWKEHETGKEAERYKYIVFGMSPYGGVAVWMKARKKSVLLTWKYANEEDLHSYETRMLERLKLFDEPVMLPPKEYFDQNMQQYTYRYYALDEYWDGNTWQRYDDDSDVLFCDHVEELLFDGTRDQLGSEYLFYHHKAGMPKNLAAVWYEERDEYRAYFWLNREAVLDAFQRAYYNKPDGKVDFLIRLDLNAMQYELALRREDMGKPIVIPKDSYEMLVLRNTNKCWQSDNYSLDWDALHW